MSDGSIFVILALFVLYLVFRWIRGSRSNRRAGGTTSNGEDNLSRSVRDRSEHEGQTAREGFKQEKQHTSSQKDAPRAYEKWTADEEASLVMYKANGFTTAQVAQKLGRTRGAIRSRLRKIRAREVLPDTREKRPSEVETLKIRFWKIENGSLTDGSPRDCDAAWIPSPDYGDNSNFRLFSREEAEMIASFLASRFGYSGEVSRSNSGRTWNLWRTPRSVFKQKARRNNRSSWSRSQRRGGVSRSNRDGLVAQYASKDSRVRDLDSPGHWCELAEAIGADPMILKSNLD